MDSWIIWASQLIITLLIGGVSYFIKRTLDEFKAGMKQQADRLAQLDTKHSRETAELRKELSELKADLPLVFVLREDHIRLMSRIEDKIDQILYKDKAKEE